MKAVVIHEYGGPDVLRYSDVPEPSVGPGDVLVQVAAASINPIDTLERAGMTRGYRVAIPGILGWDVSGTVLDVGPGVSGFAKGDRVFGWANHTYAERCAAKADVLAKLPEGLDLVEAAALPLVGTTGSQLISVASGVAAGQTVLVSGAVGGVGRAAVYTAKDRGTAVVAGVLGRQIAEARGIGVDRVVALDDEKDLAALAPVDVVANTVRGETAKRLLAKVKSGGVYASVTGAPDNARDYPSVRVVAFVSKQDPKVLAYIAKAAEGGRLSVPIARRLPLKAAAEGHALVEKGGAGGKVLLIP
jgi:NADPH:quinone reductase-like Zn-dependent oxidoreductase